MQLFRPNKKMFLRSSLICIKCPSSVFFLTIKVGSFILFLCQNQNINIFVLKLNKKGASLVFDEIKKIIKMALSVFWGNRIFLKKPACLICFSKKWPGKHLFIFNLIKDYIIEPRHEISNNVVCTTSKASDQPGHTRSLIRAFASHLNIL